MEVSLLVVLPANATSPIGSTAPSQFGLKQFRVERACGPALIVAPPAAEVVRHLDLVAERDRAAHQHVVDDERGPLGRFGSASSR